MQTPGRIAAIVLAGGYSSRMQSFKPLLPWAGTCVIERAVRTFLDSGTMDVTVVVGHRGEELRPILERLRVRCVVNPEYPRGMYSSLVAGVRSLGEEVRACFVLPADMPAIRGRTIALLARSHCRAEPSVVYPVFRGQRGHPPLISSRLFPAIGSGEGREGLRGVLSQYEGEAREVRVLDEGVLMDLDTPEDYARTSRACADRSIPTEAECEALLMARNLPDALLRHARTVSEVARRLGEGLNRFGLDLDVRLLGAAGLLHDVAKGRRDHARAGARLLRRLGFPEVGEVIGSHTDIDLRQAGTLGESAIVHLADKMVKGEDIVSPRERFR
ncbi:MAG TPA: NTP transferase domain-containing protein, partial [Anaeromyxobacteraceae bacterium]|nr:NTP transferase domain-containing protein [Anaeromyxobacteraceae bacterium]